MISSSGIIKRGLAATAISALAVAGIPALAGTAHAAVGSVDTAGVNGWTAFDIDEFAGAPNDIIVTVKETGGTPTPAGQAVEFSYVFTPPVGPPSPATAFAAGGVTDANGKVNLSGFAPAAAGTYAITVRTTGSQITDATPLTILVGEAEITYADGASALSPLNGSDTYSATLALTNGSKPVLPGRAISIGYIPAGNSVVTGPQTAPTVKVNDSSATSTTAADGKFSVHLTDPALPATPENGFLYAFAPGLNTGDVPSPGPADAQDELNIKWDVAPVVKAVAITTKDVFGAGVRAPGKPVELEIKVTGEGPTPAPGDDVVLTDIPTAVVVDKGFLTPDNKPGLTTGINDLVLTADQDDENDLFGFYQDLGKDETVDTSDDQPAPDNAAGIIATIAKDAAFNDDGQATQKVTVTAGGKTATVDITYNSENALNVPAAAFSRDGSPAGNIKVPGSVDLKLFAADQYGNLVGGLGATVSDNTPSAKVITEAGGATTDYINDNPSATASANVPVSQTVTGKLNVPVNLVNAVGDKAGQTSKDLSATHTINWAKAGGAGQTGIVARLLGANNGPAADKLTVTAPGKANGATVKLFKVVKGKLVPAGTKVLRGGKVTFTKADKNGRGFTSYVAKVLPTSDTKGDRTNTRKVR